MEAKSYEDLCELCNKEPAIFIQFPTQVGNKDICGNCRRIELAKGDK